MGKRCPWCGEEFPFLTVEKVEDFFRSSDIWYRYQKEKSPDACPYCHGKVKYYPGIPAILVGIALLIAGAAVRLLWRQEWRRNGQTPWLLLLEFIIIVLLILMACWTSGFPYQRGKGENVPIQKAQVLLTRSKASRFCWQWKDCMVQPVFFIDQNGKPVSRGVCAVFTALQRQKDGKYSAVMELVPYHEPCALPEAGGRFFLYIKGKKVAEGEVLSPGFSAKK